MTNKEAIKRLETRVKYMSDGYICALENGAEQDIEWEKEIEAFECGIKALEKQIPKKPKEVESRELFNPKYPLMAITVTTFNCPCCGEKIMFRTAVKRCLDCGQAIDWSEQE